MHKSEFRRIVVMNTLSGIGTGFVFIFIPLYLLELGHTVSAAILWLTVHHLSIILGAFIAVYFSNKIGLVRCWYIRILLAILLYAGLLVLPDYPHLIYLVALISGLEAAFFWIPYNIFTVRKTEASTMGSSLAFMSNIASAVGILIPGISALIIIHFGYDYLFYLAVFFIVLSIIPVLPLRHEKTDFHFKYEKIKHIVKGNKHFILPEILDNLSQDAGWMWTIYLFITTLTVLDIGLLGVLSGLVGMVVTHVTGSLIDKTDKKTVLRFGAVMTTILWIVSYFIVIYAPTPALLYIVTTLRGFVLGIFASAYGVIMFNRARSTDAQFIVLREIPTVFGRVIVFLMTLWFVSIGKFELTFLMVGLISLYFWFNNIDVLIKDDELRKS